MATERSVFDQFAARVSALVSRAPFFTFCVLVVAIWAPSYFLIKKLDTWQLIINTFTTIVTFLLVALTQNSQSRNDAALNHKLDALADAQADYLEWVADHSESARDPEHLRQDARELREAVGIQEWIGTDG